MSSDRATPPSTPSVVEIAITRIRALLVKDSVPDEQAKRIATIAVGAMLVDGLWLTAGWEPPMHVEFPLKPGTAVSLTFTGRPIQSDIDMLVEVLQTLRRALPESIEIGPDGFTKDATRRLK